MADPNFENRTLYQGDNLPFLQGLNSATVDLIATDPPFNKSRDFHATPNKLATGARFTDRWRWDVDVQPEWIDALDDDWKPVSRFIHTVKESGATDMAAFLCWLGVRLMECRRILKPTGSLYLHIDHTAHAYAKVLMDGIFGRDNFRNEVVWGYRTQGVAQNWWPRKHDTLLFYTKGDAWTFFPDMERQYYNKAFRHTKLDADGRHYVDTYRRDVWDNDETRPKISQSAERTGYPTQKPLALYERIIKASSNEGDMVLDPFCGCATTPVAAERLGRQWIGMDLWDGCHGIILDRLNAEKQIWRPEDVKLVTVPPERTDAADTAAPHLPQIERGLEQRPRFSNPEMKAILVHRWGGGCAGVAASSRLMAMTGSLTLTITFPSRRGGITTWTTGLSCAVPATAGKAIP